MIDAVVFVLPALTVRLPDTVGETYWIYSLSLSASTSSAFRMTVPFALELRELLFMPKPERLV